MFMLSIYGCSRSLGHAERLDNHLLNGDLAGPILTELNMRESSSAKLLEVTWPP